MKRILQGIAFAFIGLAVVFSPAYAGVFKHLRVTVSPLAEAQDFQKTYRIGAGGGVSIRNVSGNISVAGYEGDAVIVNGFREGRDKDQVEIEDMSAGNRVDIRVRYPDCRNCNASVRFEVRVPRSLRLNLDPVSTASGDIEVSNLIVGDARVTTASGNVLVKDVSGAIKATTASGEMRVRNASGSVNAQSASGDVDVEIARLEGADNMKFASASGDVNVRLPAGLDAEVEMSSATGSVKTNFPLQIEKPQYGPGSHARGRLGNGSRRLHVSSASGNVSLMSL
ncbi:MAG: DUF4097 domain-containing protein [Pyrinomonadaceae bacterium]